MGAREKGVPPGLRLIRTGRHLEAINEAVAAGHAALFRPVVPDPRIRSKFGIVRNTGTGHFLYCQDLNAPWPFGDPAAGMEVVLDLQWYYPHRFPPYAAYLLPNDLKEGEHVWLEDLVEDVIAGYSDQGDVFRLMACEAIWRNGDFELQCQPTRSMLLCNEEIHRLRPPGY
jgi:hypothetical protein